MRKLLVVLVFILWYSPVFANPLLVCDPQKAVTEYHITGLTQDMITVPATDDGNNTGHLEYDLQGLPLGGYDCNVTAYNNLWDLESPPAPFYFKKIGLESPSVIQIIAK